MRCSIISRNCTQSPRRRSLPSSKPQRHLGRVYRPHGYWLNNPHQRRNVLDHWLQSLGGSPEKFYSITKPLGMSLTAQYQSIHHAVMVEYVEQAWQPWRFVKTPRNWWKSVAELFFNEDPVAEAIMWEYIQYLNKKFGVTNIEDWMRTPYSTDLATSSTYTYQLVHFGSLYTLLRRYYPNIKWPHTPVGPRARNVSLPAHQVWKSSRHRYEFLQGAITAMGKRLDELYCLSLADLVRLGGSSLATMYHSSIPHILMTEIPYHHWKPWKFRHTPRDWWIQVGSAFIAGDAVAQTIVRCFIDEVAQRANITSLEGWMNVSLKTTSLSRVVRLGTLPVVLRLLYPEHNWNFAQTPALDPDLFQDDDNVEFESAKSRRQFLGQLCGSNFQHEALYQLSYKHFTGVGRALLNKFHQTLSLAVMVEFVEHAWKPWKFRKTNSGWWHQLNTLFKFGDPVAQAVVRIYMDDLQETFNIRKLEDWRTVTNLTLGSTIASHLKRFGGLFRLLKWLYPDHKWNFSLTTPAKKAVQTFVATCAQAMFPEEDVMQEVTPRALNFKSPKVLKEKQPMRFDICIPRLRLIFEYNSRRHYDDSNFGGNESEVMLADKEKEELCRLNGYTLIVVPYWWDNKIESLAATVMAARPDLDLSHIAQGALPIPTEVPHNVTTPNRRQRTHREN